VSILFDTLSFLWNLSSFKYCLNDQFHQPAPALKFRRSAAKKSAKIFQKVNEDFSKSQRRIFEKSAKYFLKVSEVFLKSQRRILNFAVQRFKNSSKLCGNLLLNRKIVVYL